MDFLISTPNLAFFMPVEIYGWVCGSTSGLTRKLIGAFLPIPAAISFKRGQFLFGLDVEHQNPRVERILDFLLLFADAGENDFLRIGADFEGAKQLAARDDIETAALFGEARSSARLELAFTEKQTICGTLAKA